MCVCVWFVWFNASTNRARALRLIFLTAKAGASFSRHDAHMRCEIYMCLCVYQTDPLGYDVWILGRECVGVRLWAGMRLDGIRMCVYSRVCVRVCLCMGGF